VNYHEILQGVHSLKKHGTIGVTITISPGFWK